MTITTHQKEEPMPSIKARYEKAIAAVDHSYSSSDRTSEDHRTIAIVEGLIAVAEAVDRLGDTYDKWKTGG